MPVRRKIRRGRGVVNSGSGLRLSGSGRRRKGGSYINRVPASVRKKKVSQLNKIVKSSKSGKSRGSVVSSIKSWLASAHQTAKKYNLYERGARLGLTAYNARKGQKNIGYSKHPVRSIQYVD